MNKIILLCALLVLAACNPGVQKNTRLRPVLLTDREIDVVLKEVARYGTVYDTAVHLVWGTQGRHYHSDFLEETRIHSVRSSMGYAEALLDSRKPEFRERAFDLLRAVIALQDQNPDSETCGVWPYSLEEPLATKKSPPDRNWADFTAVPLIGILNNHGEVLPPDLKEKTQKALLLASQAIRKRDVRPDYTNISLMGLYVCYMTADMFNDSGLMTYARKRLKAFYDCTVLNRGFLEYNSPAYFKLSLDEVLRLMNHVVNAEDLVLLEYIYNTGWNVIARHYHQPTAQWAGPHGRAYSVLLSPSVYSWLYASSEGKINPETPFDFSKDEHPALKHRIPADLLPWFTDPVLPRLEVDTLIRGGQRIELNPMVSYQKSDSGVWIETKEVIGTSYLTNDFVLSSANRSSLWNQRRPLIAYWGTSRKPVSLQVRFLHDGYDYAAANLFCAQDSTHVLGAVNFTTNGGDRHVTIDVIQNATIRASDLRLRFEFGGDIGSVVMAQPEGKRKVVTGRSGVVNFRIEVPYDQFGGEKGALVTGGDDKNRWIDYVVYSGSEKTFNFEEISEAVIGFLVALKIGDIADGPVEVSTSGETLQLKWNTLSVSALKSPYSERATLVLK